MLYEVITGDSVAFLHTVQEGAANRSYGIQVAALAGVPRDVLGKAKIKLHELESRDHLIAPAKNETPPSQPESAISELALNLLAELDPDQLSPRDALDWLYKLKSML